MRPFLVVLSRIATWFLLFEKSLTAGFKSDILKEIDELILDLQKLKEKYNDNH